MNPNLFCRAPLGPSPLATTQGGVTHGLVSSSSEYRALSNSGRSLPRALAVYSSAITSPMVLTE
jgi:hypothetical protein